VVTRNVQANAVVGGVPAKLIRMREAPQEMSWPDPVEPTNEDQPPPQNR
jgi:serine acetyltransferase